MALIQKQDEVIDENWKLEAVDEKSEDNLQEVDQDEVKERKENENDEKPEEKEEIDVVDDATETEILRIPISLSIDKGDDEEDAVANLEKGNTGKTKNIRNDSKNVNEDTTERGIDIVNIPDLPPLPQEPEKTKRPPSRQSSKPCRHYGLPSPPYCGYMDAYCPRPLGGYQGIGHSGFYPFVMPSLGFPVVMLPAFSPLGIYPPVMPQICCAQSMGYRGIGPYPNNRGNLENGSHMHQCPMEKHLNHYDGDYHHDDQYHSDHRHHHHHGEDQHHHGDHYDEKPHHHHHHHHHDGCEDEDRECQELENCCIQHDANDNDDGCDEEDNEDEDDTKSVEDLLEEYLEDIDEKTERIHELLDECEAMDLFINVHGFELEEIQVTACERTVTIKGDHQYTEATWVRVRNFSEGYEIPEEFDIFRTTATKTGDTLRVRIPHVDGE